jgi:Tetratricopeptide repeat
VVKKNDILIGGSLGLLGTVLSSQGKYEQGEEMHRQVLEPRETVLGKEHPSTLTSVYYLAYLVSTRKQFEKASVLYQRALSGYRLTLRPGHPTTVACERHYSSMQRKMGLHGQEKNYDAELCH